MVEFIIYEKNEIIKNAIKNTIYKFFSNKSEEFRILNYKEEYINEKYKIYILSSNNYEKVLEIAKKIRNKSNFDNPIIIISNTKNNKTNNDLLVFNYINRDENMKQELIKTICKIYSILIEKKTLNIIYDRIVYRIPLKDILYIEKEKHINKVLIHTKDTIYQTYKTIKSIEKEIKHPAFMKVHRSCIINLLNVKKYDPCQNIIYFEKDKTNIICREKKNILKENLLNIKSKH